MSKKSKFKKARAGGKGRIFRPCIHCGEQVNFVLWESETIARGRRIFHWANYDGSHHGQCHNKEIQHNRAIMTDASRPPWED